MAEKKAEAGLEERIYTIPLRREWLKQTRVQRTNRAVHAIQTFLTRHMHASGVKISPRLNELVWKSGAKKPPARVRVKAKKDAEGVVTARLPEEIEAAKVEEKKGRLKALKERATGKPAEAPEAKTEAEAEAPKKEGELTPKEEFELAEKEGGAKEKAPEKAEEQKEEKK
ncbi:MAG: 50S ribosomal protein L31e [Candidatus Aenigmatarchaeota archaeon]